MEYQSGTPLPGRAPAGARGTSANEFPDLRVQYPERRATACSLYSGVNRRLVFLVICFSRFRDYFSHWSGIWGQGQSAMVSAGICHSDTPAFVLILRRRWSRQRCRGGAGKFAGSLIWLTHSRLPLRDSRKNFSSASTMPRKPVSPTPTIALMMRCRHRHTVILSMSRSSASPRHDRGETENMSATTRRNASGKRTRSIAVREAERNVSPHPWHRRRRKPVRVWPHRRR